MQRRGPGTTVWQSRQIFLRSAGVYHNHFTASLVRELPLAQMNFQPAIWTCAFQGLSIAPSLCKPVVNVEPIVIMSYHL